MIDFIFFEDSWNEPKNDDSRGGKVHDGASVATSTTSHDTKGPRG